MTFSHAQVQQVHESGIFDQQREYSTVRSHDAYLILVEMSGIVPAAPIRLAKSFSG